MLVQKLIILLLKYPQLITIQVLQTVRYITYNVDTIFRESKGQSSAMPACTLAFASLCLQNALLLLKCAEVIPVHEPESVLESQLTKEDDSFSQETDASR